MPTLRPVPFSRPVRSLTSGAAVLVLASLALAGRRLLSPTGRLACIAWFPVLTLLAELAASGRQLVVAAMKIALGQRDKPALHHSDRGPQYTSDAFRGLLSQHGIECSMSGRGSCYDNAPVESFFSLLKRERIRRQNYPTREDAKADVFDYIERFYNRWRRHAYLGYISPVEFEKQAMRT